MEDRGIVTHGFLCKRGKYIASKVSQCCRSVDVVPQFLAVFWLNCYQRNMNRPTLSDRSMTGMRGGYMRLSKLQGHSALVR